MTHENDCPALVGKACLTLSPGSLSIRLGAGPIWGEKGNKARYGVTLAVPATVGGEHRAHEATGQRPGRQARCEEPQARKPAGARVVGPGSGKIPDANHFGGRRTESLNERGSLCKRQRS